MTAILALPPSSIHLVVALLFLLLQAASMQCVEATISISDDETFLINLHERLLSSSKEQLQAFHEQRRLLVSQRRRQQRNLHLRGHHAEDSNSHYHDTTTATMSEEMMTKTSTTSGTMMDPHEMELKMDVCPPDDDEQQAVDCLHPAEHEVIMELLNRRHQIQRVTVDVFDSNNGGRFIGVLANTTSTDSQTAAYLKAHVYQMHHLEETGQSVRQWDPLYRAMFRHLEDIAMEHTFRDDGISVLHTAETECAIELIQKHAAVVSSFVEEGREAVWREHQAPEVCYRGT